MKTLLSHKPNLLLSVRLPPNQQQSTTWHNVLLTLHPNSQITPYFDGFVGEQHWVPVINNESHTIRLGAKFNIKYRDPVLFSRPLSEPEVVVLQNNVTLTDGATVHLHCLCPEGYKISLINQYLCVSNDDQDVSYVSR